MNNLMNIPNETDRLKDLELAIYAFFMLSAVSKGDIKATPEEIVAFQIFFAEAMGRIKQQVLSNI